MPAPNPMRESGRAELPVEVRYGAGRWPAPPSGIASGRTKLEDWLGDWAINPMGAARIENARRRAVRSIIRGTPERVADLPDCITPQRSHAPCVIETADRRSTAFGGVCEL